MTKVLTKTQRAILKKLKETPYILGRQLGFTKLVPLNNEWIKDMVYGEGETTLQAHRNSYKTTCVSVALLLIIILFPNDRTKFYRKTDTNVKEVVHQVTLMLKTQLVRDIVRELWGVELRLVKESAYEITTNLCDDIRGTAQLTASGIKSSQTGQHFNRIFTDDIVTKEDRYSRAERELTKAFYDELINIIEPDGRIYNSGTPWHPEDAFTKMPEPKKYDVYRTGILTAAQIDEKREKLTPSLFAANYELKHIASEDIIFDRPQEGADLQKAMQGYAHVDAAYYGEDYTALTILNFHDGKWYVFGKCWRKHVDDCKHEIEMYYQSMQCGILYNELNADKGMLAKEFRTDGIKVSTYNENMNKYVKITSYLKFDWKNVIFTTGTDEEYIDQICDYNENAEHDDCPDSLSSLMRALWKKKHKKEQVDVDNLLFL